MSSSASQTKIHNKINDIRNRARKKINDRDNNDGQDALGKKVISLPTPVPLCSLDIPASSSSSNTHAIPEHSLDSSLQRSASDITEQHISVPLGDKHASESARDESKRNTNISWSKSLHKLRDNKKKTKYEKNTDVKTHDTPNVTDNSTLVGKEGQPSSKKRACRMSFSKKTASTNIDGDQHAVKKTCEKNSIGNEISPKNRDIKTTTRRQLLTVLMSFLHEKKSEPSFENSISSDVCDGNIIKKYNTTLPIIKRQNSIVTAFTKKESRCRIYPR